MQHKPTVVPSGQPPLSHSNGDLSQQQLDRLLQGVSRSFYLTLRVLPTAIRPQIALAYLLARAADTLADSTVLPASGRLAALQLFQQQLDGDVSTAALAEIQTQLSGNLQNRDEAQLLQQLPQLFELLAQCSATDRKRIERVVTTLSSGMIYDLATFPAEESGEVRALQTAEALDRYTYMVAGCVGEFWTEIGTAHLPALHHWDRERYSALGIRYGKGLQLTNILRDLPRDLRLGRCYLPQQWLERYDLNVAMLMERHNSELARPLLQSGITLALEHFAAATEYVTAIPRRAIRMRLAALWPLLIGLGTLERLAASATWLDAEHVIKVDRRWVYRMMWWSLPCAVSNGLIGCWVGRLVSAVERHKDYKDENK